MNRGEITILVKQELMQQLPTLDNGACWIVAKGIVHELVQVDALKLISQEDTNNRAEEKRMIFTKERMDEFEKAAEPLIKWLCDNCHPHVTAIVEPNRVELLEGNMMIKCDKYIKD